MKKHSFKEIAEELGVSVQRAHQIYLSAMEKVNNMPEQQHNEINELMAQSEPADTLYDKMVDNWYKSTQSLEDDKLRGFWNEKEAAK